MRDGAVETAGGTVRAPEIVLATNAALTGWSPASRNLTNFGSYVVLTEPVPELLAEIGWTGGEAIVDGRMFLHYFRTTNDGRVLMGSGSGPIGFGGRVDERFTPRPADGGARGGGAAAAAAGPARGARRARVGRADRRLRRSPAVLRARSRARGSTTAPATPGTASARRWLGGQILASLALGADDEWTRLPLATRHVPRLPPEPFRRVGGGLVRASIMACEAAEEQGKRPPLAARAGAALPRLLGMELGTR